MIANERKKVMYVRKMRNKWQCLVRMKGASISQSFYNKSDATRWGKMKEVEIENGTNIKDLKLTSMRLKDCYNYIFYFIDICKNLRIIF